MAEEMTNIAPQLDAQIVVDIIMQEAQRNLSRALMAEAMVATLTHERDSLIQALAEAQGADAIQTDTERM